MVSLRFPFLFSPPAKPPVVTTSNVASRSFSTAAVACSVAVAVAVAGGGIAAGIATPENPSKTFLQNALNLLMSRFSPNANHSIPMWCSLSLADNSSTVTESKTGFTFPSVLKDTQRLLGVGLRKKSLLGLKNIDVYAFGVYADDGDVKKLLSEKKQEITTEALMESDINLTVRLQIVYGRLSIRSVRSAFEESVGSRLQKFGGSDNKELLQRFTSQFKDEYKIPRGSIIDLSRERGHVLRTIIDGKEVGSIESKVLCRSVLDLYIGNDPFDPKAKKDVEASLLPS